MDNIYLFSLLYLHVTLETVMESRFAFAKYILIVSIKSVN